ncbi:MAG: chemotaxis-specific protein-glutamate methyltransferase CheB [Chitinivibrionales bacterium]|nr:chemotaxis-specific protein-glutamate methyltransferase CheB [Chitinivibrionales bacterium]
MPIKILVVDDSVLYRRLAFEVAASLPDIEVVGTAPNGDLALRKLRQNPVDLVLCDVHMPEKDGVETLAEIQREFSDTLVVMMSGISTRSASITIKALQMGALDFIRKPDGATPEENRRQLHDDLNNVLRHVRTKMNTRRILRRDEGESKAAAPPPSRPERIEPVVAIAPIPRSFGVLTIGVSTGGPEALNKLIPQLPAGLPVPVLLVQHMPAHFTKSLAESLDKKSALKVVEGEDGQSVQHGIVYIAPGGRHMTVVHKQGRVRIALNDGPPENSCRPAVDVLFRSVANVYGSAGIMSCVLTGMGSDGAKGMRVLKRRGCYCVTQSDSSCVVYGMPRAVDEAGLSDKSLPIESIAAEIGMKLHCR